MIVALYVINHVMYKDYHKKNINYDHYLISVRTALLWQRRCSQTSSHEYSKTGKEAQVMKAFINNDFVPIIKSVCSLNLKIEVLVSALLGGFSIGMISGLVSNWIFDPAVSYYFLIGLIVSDHLAGVTIAFKNNKFETKKSLRILWTLLAHTALLSFSTNLAKGSDAIYWLNEAIFVPVCLVNMISLMKNLALLGLIKNDVADFFYRKVDVYKNEYIEKKENTPNSDIRGNDGC